MTREQMDVWWALRLALLGWPEPRVSTSTSWFGVDVLVRVRSADGKWYGYKGGLAWQMVRDPDCAAYVADWARELVIDLKAAAGHEDAGRQGALFSRRLPSALRRLPRTGGAVVR